MFANIGKIRKNHRLSRAVKGLWGPGANLPPALELLLCSVQKLNSPYLSVQTVGKDFSYCEQEVDALELALRLNVLPFDATRSMNLLPFHRTEGHTSEGSAGSSASSSGQRAKHPSIFRLSSEGTVSICLTVMGAER